MAQKMTVSSKMTSMVARRMRQCGSGRTARSTRST